MKVINREVRDKSFSGFLVGLCAVIGGTLTVAAAVDRALYEGVNRIKLPLGAFMPGVLAFRGRSMTLTSQR
jgi:hypothetical protein